MTVFPFFRALAFPTYFFDFMWGSSKVFRDIKIFWTVHLRQFIRYQGKNLDLFWIWCCIQFSCITSCNLTESSTFFFISFLSLEKDSESFKQSTFTLYASEISLFKVFINACELTSGMQNRLELFPWCLTLIVSVYKRLKFILIINTVKMSSGCLVKTLIRLVFSCWTISQVIACSRLTLLWCFSNTAQHLLSQKYYQTPVHNVVCGHSFLFHV